MTMPITSVLSNAIFGLTQSTGRAGKAVEKVVTAHAPNSLNGDPALVRTEGLMELNIEQKSFAANAAVIRAAARAEKELGRLLDVTA
tara:strand:- start:330 stop:590 length:261 start_codon:yes stop_codon:yes gene_type:complete